MELFIAREAAAAICKRCTKKRHDCYLKLAEGIMRLVNAGDTYEEAADAVFAKRDGKAHWQRDDKQYILNGER